MVMTCLKRFCLIIACCLAGHSLALAGVIYTWVDLDGVTHFMESSGGLMVFLIGLFFALVLGAIFGTIGGLIGGSVFKVQPTAPAGYEGAPPPPPVG